MQPLKRRARSEPAPRPPRKRPRPAPAADRLRARLRRDMGAAAEPLLDALRAAAGALQVAGPYVRAAAAGAEASPPLVLVRASELLLPLLLLIVAAQVAGLSFDTGAFLRRFGSPHVQPAGRSGLVAWLGPARVLLAAVACSGAAVPGAVCRGWAADVDRWGFDGRRVWRAPAAAPEARLDLGALAAAGGRFFCVDRRAHLLEAAGFRPRCARHDARNAFGGVYACAGCFGELLREAGAEVPLEVAALIFGFSHRFGLGCRCGACRDPCSWTKSGHTHGAFCCEEPRWAPRRGCACGCQTGGRAPEAEVEEVR